MHYSAKENSVSFNAKSNGVKLREESTRRGEVMGLREKFPTKIPVIVEKYDKEMYLPAIDKTKFLVPQEMTMSHFVTIIKNRMSGVSAQRTVYFIVGKKFIPAMTMTVAEVYCEHADDDGFLYMTYSSQQMFG